jgi:metal-responsive CopG/Arc/MetJ family transcriptional regulator
MKRATVTIPDELEKAVDSYVRSQEVPPPLPALIQAALREYLEQRGYLRRTGRFLRITPATEGSGRSDVSREHDRYFANE